MIEHHKAPTPLDPTGDYREGVITGANSDEKVYEESNGNWYIFFEGRWANVHPECQSTGGGCGVRWWLDDGEIRYLKEGTDFDLRAMEPKPRQERITMTIDVPTDKSAPALENELISMLSQWKEDEYIGDFDICIDKIKE